MALNDSRINHGDITKHWDFLQVTIERAPFEALIGYILKTYGGFLEWGYPKMDGL